jgi:twitching motility protein PilT
MHTIAPDQTPAAIEARLFAFSDDVVIDTTGLINGMLDSGKGISDLVFSPGRPPQVEQHGQLVEVNVLGLETLTPAMTARIARDLIGGNGQVLASLDTDGAADFSFSLPSRTRFRVNAFKQRGTFAIVMRVIASRIPSMA